MSEEVEQEQQTEVATTEVEAAPEGVAEGAAPEEVPDAETPVDAAPVAEESLLASKAAFCPNCGAVLDKATYLGVLMWECPEGDYLYPVE